MNWVGIRNRLAAGWAFAFVLVACGSGVPDRVGGAPKAPPAGDEPEITRIPDDERVDPETIPQAPSPMVEPDTVEGDPAAEGGDDEPGGVEALDEPANFAAIGCILPLSGRSRLVGEMILKGIRLGAEALPIEPGVKLSVVARDSKGSAESARDAVDRLVEDERVAAIVGPMNGVVATAVMERAEEHGVPVLLFSVQEGVAEGRQFAFRAFATNRSEVSVLIHTAARSGRQRVAVFYPESGYGKNMKALAVEVIGQVGLDFVGEVSYSPRGPSFVEAAEQLARLEFDTLFIPDSAARIALLAPALASVGLWSVPPGWEPDDGGRAIQYLIPSAGLAPDLARRAGRYLRGAMFTTFLQKEASSATAAFVSKFELIHGVPPTFLAGFGHDAAVLLAAAVRSGALTRQDIGRFLENASSELGRRLPLAMPFAGFTEAGEPMAPPWTVQLVDSEFVVLR